MRILFHWPGATTEKAYLLGPARLIDYILRPNSCWMGRVDERSLLEIIIVNTLEGSPVSSMCILIASVCLSVLNLLPATLVLL